MKEINIQQNIIVRAAQLGVKLLRNNVGAYKDKVGNWVRYGLGVGSSDLIGIRRRDGRFVAIEVKRPGEKPTKEQIQFIEHVKEFGGIAAVVTNPDQLEEILK